MKVYVGRRQFCPPNIPRLSEYDDVHPADFYQVEVTRDGWTNNPYLVDLYPAKDVMVCSAAGVKPLAEHPRWRDDFYSGEFWSLVGEGWVTPKGE